MLHNQCKNKIKISFLGFSHLKKKKKENYDIKSKLNNQKFQLLRSRNYNVC